MLKKKIRLKNNDEIDLINLFQALWIEKSKIFGITLIFLFMGAVYDHIIKEPVMYSVSTSISKGNSSIFIKYNGLNDILREENYNVNSENVYNKFLLEFNDYEEMVETLDNKKFVDQSLDLSTKRDVLFKLAKSFKIYPVRNLEKNKNKDSEEWLLYFEWSDVDEGSQLFNEAVQKTLLNVKESIQRDIKELSTIIKNNNDRELKNLNNLLEQNVKVNDIAKDQELLYLKEQSAIAKELGIEKNMLAINALIESETNNVPVSIKPNDAPYYFRGYKAIDKEISLINSRTPEERLIMRYDENISLIYKINLIESDTEVDDLKKFKEILQNDNTKNWVKYNFKLADTDQSIHTNKYVKLGLVLGLLIGIFYAIIISIIRSR